VATPRVLGRYRRLVPKVARHNPPVLHPRASRRRGHPLKHPPRPGSAALPDLIGEGFTKVIFSTARSSRSARGLPIPGLNAHGGKVEAGKVTDRDGGQ